VVVVGAEVVEVVMGTEMVLVVVAGTVLVVVVGAAVVVVETGAPATTRKVTVGAWSCHEPEASSHVRYEYQVPVGSDVVKVREPLTT